MGERWSENFENRCGKRWDSVGRLWELWGSVRGSFRRFGVFGGVAGSGSSKFLMEIYLKWFQNVAGIAWLDAGGVGIQWV